MDQPTCADLEYRGKKRTTPREILLQRMDGLIPQERPKALPDETTILDFRHLLERCELGEGLFERSTAIRM